MELPAEPTDEEIDELLASRPVFSLMWDSGGPGAGGDYESIYRWRGHYLLRRSFNDDFEPYPCLEDAVADSGLYEITPTVVSIDSLGWTPREIADSLELINADEHRVTLNGEQWIISAKGQSRPATD